MRITKEIAQEVNQFDSVESLLRSGGISIGALDRAAFGFASGDILTFKPQQLKIKWKDDIVNVKYEIQYSKLPIKTWAKKNRFIYSNRGQLRKRQILDRRWAS